MFISRLTRLLSAVLPLALACASAHANDNATAYPSKPIRFVVPFTAGGLTDKLARSVAAEMADSWKQPVVVENRPGAGGTIGADAVAKAPADGYTILMGTHATHAINVTLLDPLPYDAIKDFTPVSLLAKVPSMLLVNASLPVNSVQELVSLAKAKPGTLDYASQGVGTSGHMAGESLKKLAGIDIVHIPAKGPAQAMTDLAGNHVDILFDSVAIGMPMVKAGKVKALAVTGRERSPALPDLPTMDEAGVPNYEIELWFALFAPNGTPPQIVAKLQKEASRILAKPAIQAGFIQEGVTLVGGTPADLAKFQRSEISKWAELIRVSGAAAK